MLGFKAPGINYYGGKASWADKYPGAHRKVSAQILQWSGSSGDVLDHKARKRHHRKSAPRSGIGQ